MNDKQLLMPPKKPELAVEQDFVLFEQFWIAVGNQAVVNPTHYILTNSIMKHLANLARAVLSRKYPVLLQGPTSSGKTSMVEYLARRTGHRFVRINNHEHTDLQEYLGTYISDPNGKLVFQEGILVEAVRKVRTHTHAHSTDSV
jgi:midasin (ATPase involved in ribosome maturation)